MLGIRSNHFASFFLVTFGAAVFAAPAAPVLGVKNASADDSSATVPWRKSGMPLALAEAKANHKPLLVYWGAVWCPPCNALKAKAFHNSQFIQATASFVPVYLDGDSEEAQTWGEKLKVSGYPTLLVLNSDGQEVQRLVADDPLPELIHELQAVQGDLSSWDGMLAKATSKDASQLSDESWRRLARYDWLNDERWRDRDKELSDKLAAVVAVFPKTLKGDRDRLELQAMSARAQSLKEGELLTESERQAWLARIADIEKDRDSFLAQLSPLTNYADRYVKALFPGKVSDIKRNEFIAGYLERFRGLLKNEDSNAPHPSPGASTRSAISEDRLDAILSIASLSEGAEEFYPPLAKGEGARLKSAIDAELKRADTEEKKIMTLDALSEVYEVLGQPAGAEKIVISYLPKVRVKNELMLTIADLEKKQKHEEAALSWTEKAYREARGATGVQRGVGYIKALVKAAPTQHNRIERESRLLIAAALKRSDCFSGRSWRSMDRLTKILAEWSASQQLHTDTKVWMPSGIDCKRSVIGAEAQQRCEGFARSLVAIASPQPSDATKAALKP